MSETSTFIDQVLDGTRLAIEIDDVVKDWHEGHSTQTLREFLGFREDEYDLWLASPDFLDLILFAHVKHLPLAEVANDNFIQQQRMAARSDQAWKINKLRDWLSKHANE